MFNPWITHLKQVRHANPHLSYKECIVEENNPTRKNRKVVYMYLALYLRISVE